MEIDKKQNDNNINKKNYGEYYFKVWKNYEEIAMHFNDLIIKLRIQSIGGIAALAAILGIFLTNTNGENAVSFKYGLASIVMFFLNLFWLAIWVLDMGYYNRLLEGAVNAILLLEKNNEDFLKDKQINLSTNIEKAFKQRFAHEPKGWTKRIFNGRNGFYLIVFVILFVGFVMAFGQYITEGSLGECCKSWLSWQK